jgi:hypothetical protein
MYSAQLRCTVGASVFLTLFVGQVASFAQDTSAREKAARQAAVAYARACNLETDRAAAVLKVAAVPFFPGEVYIGGSGPQIPISMPIFKDGEELSKWLRLRATEPKLSLKVRRVETYAAFRKKFLEKEPTAEGLGDLYLRKQQAVRWALEQSVGKDGLIVFLGDNPAIGEGVLIRFDKGTAKVAGVLGITNPEWTLMGFFSAPRPAPEKGK